MSRRRINRGRLRRQELRDQAVVFAEARSTRSPEQQIEWLDRRLGEGVGAKRERHMLEVLIENKRQAKVRKGRAENDKKTKQRGFAKNTRRKN